LNYMTSPLTILSVANEVIIRRTTISYLAGLFIGPALSILIIIFVDLEPGHPEVTHTLAVAILMAVWWVTEVIPLAVTSLIPVVLFPLLGIMNGEDISSTYFNHVIFLFIGGFIVALAMERWNLHKRIALKILIFCGISSARILMGFMLATAFLSMWISNTATVMMMLPIALSVIQQLETSIGKVETARYSIGLLLGIAYSASIGGIATLVGTPPNLVFARLFSISFPKAPEISFASWFLFAFPITVLLFIFVWTYLTIVYRPRKNDWADVDVGVFKSQYHDLGRLSFEEKVVGADFIILALLWLSRSGITVGNISIPGWDSLFPRSEFINDGTVAIALSFILFLIPTKTTKDRKIMDWDTANRLPWNIVLLFGGGFALAAGFKESGLSLWFGNQLNWAAALHPIFVIAAIAFLMTFLTELTSNTATSQILLPVLGSLAVGMGINPLLFMIPATLSASMAFMLPVATPPNAIVFGTNRLRIIQMVRTGLLLNLVGVILITLIVYFWGTFILDIDVSSLPEWAETATGRP